MTDAPLRSISYGGGVQSTAMLVLAAQGKIDYQLALFSNVGDDSEHPASLEYVRNVAQPWAAAQGIEVLELKRRTRNGEVETLMGRLMKEGSRSLPIPVRMSNGAPGTRSCTADFKIRVIAKWLKKAGATEANPATVAIGISTDEIHRANNRRDVAWEVIEYPLLDLRLDRAACAQIIRDAGLPVPPKSSCFFCPFHRPQMWAEMRRDEPDLFEKAALLEDVLNDRRKQLQCRHAGQPAVVLDLVESGEMEDEDDEEPGREYVERRLTPGEIVACPGCKTLLTVDVAGRFPDHHKDLVYLTRFARPLREAIPVAQSSFDFGEVEGVDTCDSGQCWT